METLSNRMESTMQAAGIKARSFAALVGCHYTTIYDIVKRPEVIPLRIMQERIYDVLEFLEDHTRSKRLPLRNVKGVNAKTRELERLYSAYKRRELTHTG